MVHNKVSSMWDTYKFTSNWIITEQEEARLVEHKPHIITSDAWEPKKRDILELHIKKHLDSLIHLFTIRGVLSTICAHGMPWGHDAMGAPWRAWTMEVHAHCSNKHYQGEGLSLSCLLRAEWGSSPSLVGVPAEICPCPSVWGVWDGSLPSALGIPVEEVEICVVHG